MKREAWPVVYAAAATLLVAFAFVAHDRADLVWDDVPLVAHSAPVHDAHGLGVLLTHDLWGAATGTATQLYHPVPMATIWLQARLSTDPAFYRAFNVIAHVGVVALFLLWTVRRVGWSPRLAGLVSLVALVHPSVTEVVMWITGRHDSLAALAVLGALLCWPDGGAARVARAAGSSLLVLAAFFSKEPYVIAPVILALADVHRRATIGRRPWDRDSMLLALPAAAVAAGFGLRAALGIPSSSDVVQAPLGAHLRAYATIVAHYAAQIATFSNGRTTERWAPLSPGVAAVVLGLLVVVLALLAWAAWRSRPTAGAPVDRDVATALLGCAWMAVALAPHVVSLPAIGMFGNRYAYFPLLGFCLVLGSALRRLAARVASRAPALRVPLVAAAGVLVLLMTLQTAAEAALWRDAVTLFGADVAASPDDPRSLYHLATAVDHGLGCAAALPLYERAVAADATYQRAWHNLAGCSINARRWPEAVAAGRRALALAPDSPRDEYNLGLALVASGATAEGVEHLERARSLDPTYAPAREALAHVPR